MFKKRLLIYAVYVLLIALLPAIALLFAPESGADAPQTGDTGTEASDTETVTVYDTGADKTFALSMREYLIGALACEMPASYEQEALRAQAVALHSYALYMQRTKTGDGADFEVNGSLCRGYIDSAGRSALYGAAAAEYEAKLETAAVAALPYILTYDGEPIAACFFAISSGRTETAADVFGKALPYLISVDSQWDTAAEGYRETASFTSSELTDLLHAARKDFSVSGEPDGWVGEIVRSDSGAALRVTVCGSVFTGAELRTALSLRSANFTCEYADGSFTFTTLGYGHGVGMSQYGANCMAKEGSTFDAILAHYYSGATLAKVA